MFGNIYASDSEARMGFRIDSYEREADPNRLKVRNRGQEVKK